MDEILQDRLFHEESGGGVTFSGGEPMLQFSFLQALLDACMESGVRTAVDTCGFAPVDQLRSVASRTDLFLYDLKLLDDEGHLEATGVGGEPILANLHVLAREHGRLWIRIPVIPGLNADRPTAERLADFLAGIEGVLQVNLLPYHRLGLEKLRRLHREERARALEQPSARLLHELAACFRSRGLKTLIGG